MAAPDPDDDLSPELTPSLVKRVGHGGPLSPTIHDQNIASIEAKVDELVSFVNKLKSGVNIEANAIDTDHLTDGKVVASKIAEDAVGDTQLIATGIDPGDYVAPSVTVDANGRVTAIANGYDAADYPSGSPFVTGDLTQNPHAWQFLPTPLDLIPNADGFYPGYQSDGKTHYYDGTAATDWVLEPGTIDVQDASDREWPTDGRYGNSRSPNHIIRDVKVVGFPPAEGDEEGFPGVPAAARRVLLHYFVYAGRLQTWSSRGDDWVDLTAFESTTTSREAIFSMSTEQLVIEREGTFRPPQVGDPAYTLTTEGLIPDSTGHDNLVPPNHVRFRFVDAPYGNIRAQHIWLKLLAYSL